MKIPNISPQEFAQRRRHLMQQLDSNALAIIPAAHLQVRNRDADYPFRQSSDFLYLSNFNEPDAVLVLIPNRLEGEMILFCHEKDPQYEQWTGLRAGLDGAKTDYGADESFSIEAIDDILPQLMENKARVYYAMSEDSNFDQQIMQWLSCVKKKIRQGITAPHSLISLESHLHEMRLIKSEAEIAMMRYAASVSIHAHQIAMQQCKQSQWEYEIDAYFQYEFCRNNMAAAYTSIVGGGKNACILHYIENNQRLNQGELLLIDAGAEHQGYASDITRTFPINGRFSTEQKQLYQIVLDAQSAAIAMAQPNNSWDQPHTAAVEVITQGLLDLGILQGNVQQLIEDEAYTPYFMHKTGHWLGLDVHDVGDYRIAGKWRDLAVGMVLTVEPGLYISPAQDVDEKWWNIGIRIEDDVLITAEGNEVLTQGLIKEIKDIETWMQTSC